MFPSSRGPSGTRLRRWRQLLANRGVWMTLKSAAMVVRRRLSSGNDADLPSELWRSPGLLPAQPHPFDLRMGTDTSGLVWGEQLPTGHAHDRWNTAYYGVPPSIFRQSLELARQKGMNPSRFTFLDIGSGKGRAVLLASMEPFARIVGVELVPRLDAIARRNLTCFSRHRPSGSLPELLLADASDFPWTAQLQAQDAPPLTGPLLLFLYNPFARPVLRALLQRVNAQGPHPEVFLLYINPELDDELLRHSWVAKLADETLALDEEDRLADRFGSTSETVALYRIS